MLADADLDAAAEGAHLGIPESGPMLLLVLGCLLKTQSMILLWKRLSNYRGNVGLEILDPATEQGPQVDRDQFEKIMGYIKQGQMKEPFVQQGDNALAMRVFVEPTVFTEVQDEMAIARDEIFGPVLSVLRFSDIDELVHRANATTFGLAAAVWTSDVNKAHMLAHRLALEQCGSTATTF